MYTYTYIYIYIYYLFIYLLVTPNLPTNIVGFSGFDSGITLIVRGGILMSIGDFSESLSRAMSVGVMLVGRFGVNTQRKQENGNTINKES